MKAKVHLYNKPVVELDIVRVVPNTDQTVGVYYKAAKGIETYISAQFVEF